LSTKIITSIDVLQVATDINSREQCPLGGRFEGQFLDSQD